MPTTPVVNESRKEAASNQITAGSAQEAHQSRSDLVIAVVDGPNTSLAARNVRLGRLVHGAAVRGQRSCTLPEAVTRMMTKRSERSARSRQLRLTSHLHPAHHRSVHLHQPHHARTVFRHERAQVAGSHFGQLNQIPSHRVG